MKSKSTKLKKIAIALLKVCVSVALLSYLSYKAWQDEAFNQLWAGSKHWSILGAALVVTLAAVSITFVRWYCLVRAAGVPFLMRDAFRLGFLGFLFNFFSLGIIGGDVLKAVFLARSSEGQRVEAAASVVIDRLIGLYGMLVVGTIAFLLVDLNQFGVGGETEIRAIHHLARFTIALTIAGALGGLVLFLPMSVTRPFTSQLVVLPLVGNFTAKVLRALAVYRRRTAVLVAMFLLSLGVHVLNSISIYLVAQGLPNEAPGLQAHFVIAPMAMIAGAFPLPGGFGAFEIALDFLYRGMASVPTAASQGFVVALAFRVIQILIALIGVVYYFTGRREVDELVKEAEHQAEQEEGSGAPAGDSYSGLAVRTTALHHETNGI